MSKENEVNEVLSHTISLTTGNGKGSETYFFMTNHSTTDIRKFYELAAKKYDIDLTEQCSEFEDPYLKEDFVEKCRITFQGHEYANKIINGWTIDKYEEDWGYYINHHQFTELYLMIAKLSEPNLHWRSISGPEVIDVGGFGLYVA